MVFETRFFVILWRSIPVALEASAVWTVSFFSMNLCQIPLSLRYFSRSVGLALPKDGGGHAVGAPATDAELAPGDADDVESPVP